MKVAIMEPESQPWPAQIPAGLRPDSWFKYRQQVFIAASFPWIERRNVWIKAYRVRQLASTVPRILNITAELHDIELIAPQPPFSRRRPRHQL